MPPFRTAMLGAWLPLLVPILAAAAPAATTAPADQPPVDLKFSFSPQPPAGFTPVTPTDAYSPQAGYGFDLLSKVTPVSAADPRTAGVTGKDGKAFFFSAKLGPGVYRVTVTLGDPTADSVTTVKSETRRLMLEAIHVPAGQQEKRTFLVHVRIPQIPGDPQGRTVAFKPRERDPILFLTWDGHTQIPFTELDWDEKLTLEFTDAHPALDAVEITRADHPLTIYLIGDSTVTDQMMQPWAAWGQQLPRFFKPPVVIANYAECGETTASFIGERRWEKVLSEIHPGDYVFMQFGINDQRMPVAQFKNYFVRFVNDTRAHDAIPVLVTSQNLRRLGPDGQAVETLRDFPEAMRQVASEKKVALIDLNAMSMKFYQALGPANLPKAFVDGTHQDDYGSYELAKCVVQGIIDDKLPFAQYLADGWKPFDPAHPDPIASIHLPMDPQLDPARPGGPGAPNGQGPMAAPRSNRRPRRGGRPTTRPTP